MFVNINKQGSTVQNSTRKHTKREEKVKLDKEGHQDARQNVKLDSCLEQSTCSMEITSFALNNFASEKFFWGGQICNDEYTSKNSKNVDFDCIMKAFFDERKKHSTLLNITNKKHMKNSRGKFRMIACDSYTVFIEFGLFQQMKANCKKNECQ